MAAKKTTGVAKQALGFVEEKLRRVFKLAGPIGTTLDPEVKPVVIVDDLRDPGHAFYQGRSWIVRHTVNTGATGGTGAGTRIITMNFLDDVIVEGFSVYGQIGVGFVSGQSLALFQLSPADFAASPPLPTGSDLIGAWRDRITNGNDQPPIRGHQNFVAYTAGNIGTVQTKIIELPGGFVPVPAVFPVKIFVSSGGALVWDARADIGPLALGVWGRVFPQ